MSDPDRWRPGTVPWRWQVPPEVEMKGLDKEQQRRHARLVEELHQRAEALDAAVDKFNEVLSNARDRISLHRDKYQEKIEEARAFVEEIHEGAQAYYDEQSERWQESDNGQVYQDWLDEIDGLTLEDCDIELPDEVDTPTLDHGDTLAGLSLKPGSPPE